MTIIDYLDDKIADKEQYCYKDTRKRTRKNMKEAVSNMQTKRGLPKRWYNKKFELFKKICDINKEEQQTLKLLDKMYRVLYKN